MPSLSDYMSTWFVSDDAIADERERDAAQQAIIDRQRREGKLGFLEHWQMSGEISGNGLEQYVDDNDNFFAVIPWWVYAALLVTVFWYLGGFFWLKGVLARR